MKPERVGLVMGILVFIVIVLAGIVIYAFIIKPAVSDYVVNKQISAYNQGQADLLVGILQQIQQSGVASIPVGNQTIYLTQYVPQQ